MLSVSLSAYDPNRTLASKFAVMHNVPLI